MPKALLFQEQVLRKSKHGCGEVVAGKKAFSLGDTVDVPYSLPFEDTHFTVAGFHSL